MGPLETGNQVQRAMMETLQDQQFWLLLIGLNSTSSWVIRLTMLVLVPMRHTPTAAMAWLMVIFFWPWPCLIIYLTVGSNLLPQKRIRRHQKLVRQLKFLRHRFKHALSGTVPELPPSLHRVSELAESLGHMAIAGGNNAKILTEARDLSRMVAKDIDLAQRDVNLLYYIFGDDNIGGPVAEALVRASQRGVDCRLMVDSVGSRYFIKSGRTDWLRSKGVKVTEALPASLFRRHAARFDLRNHRKLAIVDGSVAYTGSHNMIDSRYGRKNLIWRDMSVRLEGPVVRQLQAVFMEDWYVETGEEPDFKKLTVPFNQHGDIAVQAVPSGPSYKTENYQRLIVSALHDADQRVVITTPYLIPDESLLLALEVVSLRGVRVQLIVPSKSDQFLVGHASNSYYQELLDMGIEVYQFNDGLLHAKTMTVDGELAFFGSSNFDIRSFALNFEINLIFYGKEETGPIVKAQEKYMTRSTRLSASAWSRRPLYLRSLESVAKLFSPLL